MFAAFPIEARGVVEIIGGEFALALLTAADTPCHPADGGGGFLADRATEKRFRFRIAPLLGGLGARVVQLRVAQLHGFDPRGPLPVTAG